MSLPDFDVQGSLFESLGSIAADLFDDEDKYKLFARKVWPLLAAKREELALDYKSTAEVLQAKRRQAGCDCLRLLNWLKPLKAEIRQAKAVALLREVFAQQYEVDQSGKTSRSSVESIEPVKVHATGVVQNPHDPEAQWSAKGQGKQKKDWVGYKVQVAETVGSQEDPSSFITSVVTQRATESDVAGLPATLQKQEALGLERPSELYADGAYISGQAIQEAKAEGWELVGPAQRCSQGSSKGISDRSLRY